MGQQFVNMVPRFVNVGPQFVDVGPELQFRPVSTLRQRCRGSYGVRAGSESRRTPITDVPGAPDVHTARRPSIVGATTG